MGGSFRSGRESSQSRPDRTSTATRWHRLPTDGASDGKMCRGPAGPALLNRRHGTPQLPRIRIGIDTGGTFTDVVAFDEESGELVTTKTPSTPGQPGRRLHGRHRQGARPARPPRGHGDAIAAVSHGTTVATNQLLEGKVDRLGFITTEGYEAMLEIARQSVPDGYGNSYFWVKPDRIVPARPGQGRRRPARLHRRGGAAVRRGAARARSPAGSGRRASTPSASASCTPTPTPSTRSGCARCSPRSTPTPSSRSAARCCASTASTSGR